MNLAERGTIIALGKRIQAASVLTRHPRQVGLGLASGGSCLRQCPVHNDAVPGWQVSLGCVTRVDDTRLVLSPLLWKRDRWNHL